MYNKFLIRYLEPLTSGDYPFIMKAIVGERLPSFTEEEKKLVQGSYDFIAINYYTSRYAEGLLINANDMPISYDADRYINYYVENGGEYVQPSEKMIPLCPLVWDPTNVSVYPKGLMNLLIYLKNYYNNPKIFISENGTGEGRDDTIPISEALKDVDRIKYIDAHIKAVYEALSAGVNVQGYFVWSLIDGMEPNQGYTLRMGLTYIDYLNNLNRIPKQSAEWLENFMRP